MNKRCSAFSFTDKNFSLYKNEYAKISLLNFMIFLSIASEVVPRSKCIKYKEISNLDIFEAKADRPPHLF